MPVHGQRILVIGANGVLGAAITRRLITAGATVDGTARSAESSDRLPDGLAQRLLVDVGDQASVRTLTEYLLASGQELDGIVIASGLVAFGTAADTPPEVAERLMRVNHLGPAALISALLPALTASAAAGRSPFVASIPGVVAEKAFPGMSAYVASKSAHAAWLRALRLELRRPLIRVIEARPGHTETGLAGRAVFGTAPAFPTGMAADHVAEVIVAAIDGGAHELASTDFSAGGESLA